MAQFHVMVRLLDGTGGRKKGDFVSMKELPHNGWGGSECLPNYGHILINNVNKNQMDPYHKRNHKVNLGDEALRCLYGIDVNEMDPFVGEIPQHTFNNFAQFTQMVVDRSEEEESKSKAKAK